MFSTKEIQPVAKQNSSAEGDPHKVEKLPHGKKVSFEIKTELGNFRGILTPTEDAPNQISRNNWTLTIDLKAAIMEIENSGGYANHNAYKKKAVLLAEKIQNLYGLELVTDNCDGEIIELIVRKR